MPFHWIFYRGKDRPDGVVIIDGETLVDARVNAIGFEAGATFAEGHMLNPELAAIVEPQETGRFLSLSEANAIIKRFEGTSAGIESSNKMPSAASPMDRQWTGKPEAGSAPTWFFEPTRLIEDQTAGFPFLEATELGLRPGEPRADYMILSFRFGEVEVGIAIANEDAKQLGGHLLAAAANTCPKRHCYSITSSARRSKEFGIVRPMVLAALRLITKWNLLGYCTASALILASRSKRSVGPWQRWLRDGLAKRVAGTAGSPQQPDVTRVSGQIRTHALQLKTLLFNHLARVKAIWHFQSS